MPSIKDVRAMGAGEQPIANNHALVDDVSKMIGSLAIVLGLNLYEAGSDVQHQLKHDLAFLKEFQDVLINRILNESN